MSAAEVQPREVRLKVQTSGWELAHTRNECNRGTSTRIIKKSKSGKFRFLIFSFEILPQTL